MFAATYLTHKRRSKMKSCCNPFECSLFVEKEKENDSLYFLNDDPAKRLFDKELCMNINVGNFLFCNKYFEKEQTDNKCKETKLSYPFSCFFVAMRKNDVFVIKSLLNVMKQSKNYDFNCPSVFGVYPLEIGAIRNSYVCLKELILFTWKEGFQLHLGNAIELAIQWESVEYLELLLTYFTINQCNLKTLEKLCAECESIKCNKVLRRYVDIICEDKRIEMICLLQESSLLSFYLNGSNSCLKTNVDWEYLLVVVGERKPSNQDHVENKKKCKNVIKAFLNDNNIL